MSHIHIKDPVHIGSFSFLGTNCSEGFTWIPKSREPNRYLGTKRLCSEQPWISGRESENIQFDDGVFHQSGSWYYYRNADFQLGCYEQEITTCSIEAVTREAYTQLLLNLNGFKLYRIWNFIPAINLSESSFEERYQLFCKGRSIAFEEHFKKAFNKNMPAASAVGCGGSCFRLYYLSGRFPCINLENPEQMPAYHYPSKYGPRSPSFSRAGVVDFGSHLGLFVSGTSSIKSCESMAVGDILGQTKITVDNIIKIASEAGFELMRQNDIYCHYRVYLRSENDFEVVREELESTLVRTEDSIIWVQSDICRKDLLIEIELTAFMESPEFLNSK